MKTFARVPLALLASSIYVLMIFLYLHNELNQHLLGIIIDSLGLTGVTLIFLLAMFHIYGWQLTESYFRLRSVEVSTPLFSILGVKHFKRMLHRSPWPSITRRIRLESRTRSEFNKLAGEMRKAEQVHFVGLLMNIGLAGLFGLYRDGRFLVWLMLFNIVLNLYPVLVQRYNRNRVQRLMKRLPS